MLLLPISQPDPTVNTANHFNTGSGRYILTVILLIVSFVISAYFSPDAPASSAAPSQLSLWRMT
jgi:hypothetical protein